MALAELHKDGSAEVSRGTLLGAEKTLIGCRFGVWSGRDVQTQLRSRAVHESSGHSILPGLHDLGGNRHPGSFPRLYAKSI